MSRAFPSVLPARLLVAAAVLVSAASAIAAPIPLTLTTNGYLLDSADVPVSAQGVSLGFSVWSDPDSRLDASRVWPATGESACVVDVRSGYYAALLDGAATGGCGAGLSTSAVPATQARYLQVSVNGSVLLPRMRLGMVPSAALAMHALDADTVGGEAPGALHDASKLTGTAPASVLGAGSTALSTLGTVTTGTWNATPLADAAIASAGTWNARLAEVAHDATLVGAGTAASPLGVSLGIAAGTVAAGDDARFGRWSGTATGLDAATARTSLGLGSAARSDVGAFATAAQGTKADEALARSGGTLTGALALPGGGAWTTTGRLGIGTATPAAALDVNGAARVQGVSIDASFRTDEGTYFAPQAYFEAGTFPFSLLAGAAPTFTSVPDTTVPFGRVALSTGLTEFAGDFVPVQPGDVLYGEIWAMRASGSTGAAGGLYFGVSRFDKDKKPIATNVGLDYFAASGATVPQTGVWTRYAGTTTLPTSHTPFGGSDGGAVRYVRPYVIVNYQSGTIPTQWGGLVMRRVAPQRDAGILAVKGNLGIGNTNPTARLDVTGAMRLRDGAFSSRSYTRHYVNFAGNVPKKLQGWDGANLGYSRAALAFCWITGTSAPGTSLWMVKQHENAAATNSLVERIGSFGLTGSNTPEIFVDADRDLSIRMFAHTDSYDIACSMTEIGQ